MTKRIYSKWTKDDIEILKQYYPTEGTRVVNRFSTPHPCTSIREYAIKYNLKFIGSYNPNRKNWTEEELEIIKKYYAVDGKNIVNRLKDRSLPAIRVKAISLGLCKSHEKWTDEDINTLKEYYPIMGMKVSEKLKNHSLGSIRMMASRYNLKLINREGRKEEIVEYVKNNYNTIGVTQCAKNLNVSRSYIFAVKRSLNLPSNRNFIRYNQKTRAKRIICVETGIIYNSITEAHNMTGINPVNCLRGRCNTSGGYHWEYINTTHNNL